ncbi:PASTA domain-containing protein [Amycolatopsis sp. QT-25]|uniref:PASTA domain-containing protein n=1 Tax=Amycolatopsis sp. QT-25 TaxID=3034022 RepID=UPI0023EB15B8|nr:PASTA domain-containing protein [Amycolatopsis sp. QT-25]WET77723.1 PASTA domain-containing protein [Amycolatopsis sp. QT-25]
MPKTVALILVTAVAMLTACGTPGARPEAPQAVSTVTETSASVQRPPETSGPASSAVRLIVVPDVSGMNHQEAQDAMQAAGLYNLREVDGTGKGRVLALDRNWVQTGQDPAPGTKVAADAVITLTAVKIGEK